MPQTVRDPFEDLYSDPYAAEKLTGMGFDPFDGSLPTTRPQRTTDIELAPEPNRFVIPPAPHPTPRLTRTTDIHLPFEDLETDPYAAEKLADWQVPKPTTRPERTTDIVLPTPPRVPGTIDLRNQPRVKNADGTTSTVDSFSVNLDGREVLLSSVLPDGRHVSQPEAIDYFKRTGRHLGMFDTPEQATTYAQQLHTDYEQGRLEPMRLPALALKDPGDITVGEARAFTEAQPPRLMQASLGPQRPPLVPAPPEPELNLFERASIAGQQFGAAQNQSLLRGLLRTPAALADLGAGKGDPMLLKAIDDTLRGDYVLHEYDPTTPEHWLQVLGNVGGSAVAFGVTGHLLAGGVGGRAALHLTTALESITNAADSYANLVTKGMPRDQAREQATLVLAGNLLINKFTNAPFFEAIGGDATIRKLGKSIAGEALQEPAQGVLGRIVEGQPLDEGLLEDFVGGVMGGTIQTVTGQMLGGSSKPPPPAPPPFGQAAALQTFQGPKELTGPASEMEIVSEPPQGPPPPPPGVPPTGAIPFRPELQPAPPTPRPAPQVISPGQSPRQPGSVPGLAEQIIAQQLAQQEFEAQQQGGTAQVTPDVRNIMPPRNVLEQFHRPPMAPRYGRNGEVQPILDADGNWVGPTRAYTGTDQPVPAAPQPETAAFGDVEFQVGQVVTAQTGGGGVRGVITGFEDLPDQGIAVRLRDARGRQHITTLANVEQLPVPSRPMPEIPAAPPVTPRPAKGPFIKRAAPTTPPEQAAELSPTEAIFAAASTSGIFDDFTDQQMVAAVQELEAVTRPMSKRERTKFDRALNDIRAAINVSEAGKEPGEAGYEAEGEVSFEFGEGAPTPPASEAERPTTGFAARKFVPAETIAEIRRKSRAGESLAGYSEPELGAAADVVSEESRYAPEKTTAQYEASHREYAPIHAAWSALAHPKPATTPVAEQKPIATLAKGAVPVTPKAKAAPAPMTMDDVRHARRQVVEGLALESIPEPHLQHVLSDFQADRYKWTSELQGKKTLRPKRRQELQAAIAETQAFIDRITPEINRRHEVAAAEKRAAKKAAKGAVPVTPKAKPTTFAKGQRVQWTGTKGTQSGRIERVLIKGGEDYTQIRTKDGVKLIATRRLTLVEEAPPAASPRAQGTYEIGDRISHIVGTTVRAGTILDIVETKVGKRALVRFNTRTESEKKRYPSGTFEQMVDLDEKIARAEAPPTAEKKAETPTVETPPAVPTPPIDLTTDLKVGDQVEWTDEQETRPFMTGTVTKVTPRSERIGVEFTDRESGETHQAIVYRWQVRGVRSAEAPTAETPPAPEKPGKKTRSRKDILDLMAVGGTQAVRKEMQERSVINLVGGLDPATPVAQTSSGIDLDDLPLQSQEDIEAIEAAEEEHWSVTGGGRPPLQLPMPAVARAWLGLGRNALPPEVSELTHSPTTIVKALKQAMEKLGGAYARVPGVAMTADELEAEQEAGTSGVPITVGSFKARAWGIYKPDYRTVRVRIINDLAVIFHESGHAIDYAFGTPLAIKMGGNVRRFTRPFSMTALSTAARQELAMLGMNTTPPGAHPATFLREGAAELFRRWLTMPADTAAIYPNATAAFERQLALNKPLEQALHAIRKTTQEYLAQELAVRGKLRIAMDGKHPGERQGIRDYLSLLRENPELAMQLAYNRWIDDLGGVKDIHSRAYRIMRAARYANGKAEDFLFGNGVTFFDGTQAIDKNGNVIRSLKAILRPVEQVKQSKEFAYFLAMRRVQEVRAKGKETGVVPEEAADYMRTIQQSPHYQLFLDTADHVYAYQKALLQYMVEAGVLSKKAYRQIVSENEFYVPMQRVFEVYEGSMGQSSRKLIDRMTPVYKQTGSGRDIINPLESIIGNTIVMINAADNNRGMQTLRNWVKKHPGLGHIMEPIEKWERRVVGLERIAKMLGKSTIEPILDPATGLPKLDSRGQPRMKPIHQVMSEHGVDLDRLMVLWYDSIQRDPTQREITILVDGEPELWQVHDDALWDSLSIIGAWKTDALLAGGEFAVRLLRRAVTSMPSFLYRNFWRDLQTQLLQGRFGAIPVYESIRGGIALHKEWRRKRDIERTGTTSRLGDIDARFYHSRGLAQTTMWGADRSRRRARDVLKTNIGLTLTEEKNKTFFDKAKSLPGGVAQLFTGLFHYLEDAGVFIESATRVGELKLYRESGGQERSPGMLGIIQRVSDPTPKSTMPWVAQPLAPGAIGPMPAQLDLVDAVIAAADVTVDFRRGGSMAKDVNRYYAFFNARMQGLVRQAETLQRHPVAALLNYGVLMTMVTAGLHLWNHAEDDDDEHGGFNEYYPATVRQNYWLVRLPNHNGAVAIAKPFEHALLANLFEAYLDYLKTNNPTALKQITHQLPFIGGFFGDQAFTTLLFNIMPTLVVPAAEWGFNRDAWTGRPIVSIFEERPGGIDPSLRGRDYTSKTLTALTAVLRDTFGPSAALSPAHLEAFLQGHTGTMGQFVINSIDAATDLSFRTNVLEWLTRSSWRGPAHFSATVSSQSDAIIRFHEQYNEMQSYESSVNDRVKAHDPDRAMVFAKEALKKDWFPRMKLMKQTHKELGQLYSVVKATYDNPNFDESQRLKALNHLRGQMALKAQLATATGRYAPK